ncbi:MAG: hypothetical protein ACD_41C00025G0006 [uncultured bacterium]|nr:MAG: hypothetical protein ACD_41C00025G0006 [uncultured bacterium]HBY73680.1 hypothetical protein [Candidatus Kerfeldbacteria bacterium]
MSGMRPEQEHRENEVTPLERHLLAHYQPVLDAAHDLFQRLHNGESTEDAIEAALSPAVSYADLEAIAKFADLDPDKRSQLIIQTMIKQLDTVKMSIDRVLEPGEDALAQAVAAAAGVTETNSLDPRSRRLLVFAVMALHQSEFVPGISDGWNKLLIPGSLVYRHIETGQWDDTAEAERTGQLHIRGLANGGYLQTGAPVRYEHRQTKFFFSMNRHVGKQFRRSEQYRQWLEHHRNNEDKIQTVAEAAYQAARPCPPKFVPRDDIRLINQAHLEGLLTKAQAGNLLSMVKLGYALPAGNYNRDKDRFRVPGETGRIRRHYFVGTTIDALTDWKQSPEYRAWLSQDTLETVLLHEWKKRLEPHCLTKAEFVPEPYQPAYLLSAAVVQDSVQKIFSVIDLSTKGYLLLADRDDTYIYWPNPEQGLAHRTQTHLRDKTYTERRTEHVHGVLKQLVDHCFKTEKRPDFPAHLPPPS